MVRYMAIDYNGQLAIGKLVRHENDNTSVLLCELKTGELVEVFIPRKNLVRY